MDLLALGTNPYRTPNLLVGLALLAQGTHQTPDHG